ncbi:MAG: nucleotidyltransferase family protein [Vulcanimicrobiota bacterium]
MGFDFVLLAGGRPDEKLGKYSDGKTSKSFIDVAGRPMVAWEIDAIKQVDELERLVLVANPDEVTPEIKEKVDILAPAGNSIIDSLRSGVGSLENPTERILVLPADLPLITSESISVFLKDCINPPVDITFGYLSKEDSEAKYPDVNHTYVNIKEGKFCGAGLSLMRPQLVEACAELFNSFTRNRKNPIGLANTLGFKIIFKYVIGVLHLSDVEARILKLMGGCTGRGVRTRYPEVGFNVDAPNELEIARRILGEK